MAGILTDAIRYWDARRIPYNGVLALVVIVVFLLRWPASPGQLTVDSVELIFVLAVLANVAYCAAYVVDLAAQSSAYRATWKRHQGAPFVIGALFASIIARFFAAEVFDHA